MASTNKTGRSRAAQGGVAVKEAPATKRAAAKTRTGKSAGTGGGANTAPVTARIVAVQDDLVEIEAQTGPDGELAQLVKNEVIHICPGELNERGEQERLKAEILRVRGACADAQVYESTRGVAVGDRVDQSGELLSVDLGPGLLGQVFDGLQAPLAKVAAE